MNKVFPGIPKKSWWIGAAAVFCLLSGCAQPLSPQTEYVLGTFCTINLYTGGTQALYRQIFTRLWEIEAALSANLDDSDVERINRQAGIRPAAVGEDALTVIEAALRYAVLSGGAFDPTIGPLVRLWGIGTDDGRVPEDDEIQAVLPLINWQDVDIDHGPGQEAGTIFLRRSGMRLDLGAIAKGYAADEVIRILQKAPRVRLALIDLGGNIFAYGEKEGNLPWRIGVQNPLDSRGAYIGILEVRNKTVVTSGIYERFLEAGGTRYHHILSSKNGYPANNGLLSVTITADRSIDADALSTAAFALGWEAGAALVESVPGAEALFVFEDMTIRGTSGALESFSLSDPGFRIAR
jgi:thiamine biosynthesis lipoprotein